MPLGFRRKYILIFVICPGDRPHTLRRADKELDGRRWRHPPNPEAPCREVDDEKKPKWARFSLINCLRSPVDWRDSASARRRCALVLSEGKGRVMRPHMLVSALVTLGLAACGTSGRESGAPWRAASESGAARPVAVAWTSARAAKCGFSFDPAELRANFLAQEAKNGADPETLQKTEKAYDFTLERTSKALTATAGYCSKVRIENIRADLTRHLAGDFAPGPKRESDKIEEN